ncbi:GNAT family N-acetyltransferase [Pengzhenrongella sicca]|uniref:GNAT family N-acetyltransferase n=1 Tax=Pengzhenrongella sicca TaxID=2819238 RepID=A0A8A4ZD35_9MICO|nr:GNAT family N-acetyltransferase [Pengzhenrongella sicca]QTE29331.1 GNAT family N-acetyltransferase [Pengzhenrongella sicca]
MSTPVRAARHTIVDAPVPRTLADDDAWAVLAVASLERLAGRARWGHEDLVYTARESLVSLREDGYVRHLQVVAVDPDHPRQVLGAALLRLPQAGNTHLAEFDVLVRPDRAGTGVDDALLAAAEVRAVAAGRRVVILSSEQRGEPAADEPGVLVAPTGCGRIRRADPGVALAERSGYALEQAERYSVLGLPVPPERLASLLTAAAAAAGPDYRTLTWADRCPPQWVDELARLQTRMGTDAPSAGLELEEDPWDAARVRAVERSIGRSGRGQLVTAAEHVPTRTLAAFTSLEYPLDSPGIVFQEDTLVAREHRGRRLGMLVKATNLDRLAATRPQARRVHTWNAEENSYMLAINVALGFAGAGVYAMWQKRLA